MTKKSILSIVMALAMMLSLFSVATFAATTTGENGTKNYELPRTSTIPTLDGDLSDATWSGETLTIQLNLKDCVANGGYAKNPTTSGATGELKAVWSDAGDQAGLYFAWHVKDETQSWAADIEGIAFNAMDAVQVVIDPLYKRRTSKTDCAMCFTFTAYASMSGNGMCPTESGRWYEYWMWQSANAASGVQMGSATNKRPDDIKENGIDRAYLLDEYWIEAYLPASALNVGNQEPEFKVGTKMGIGFTLIDYDWISEGFVINETNIADTQRLINLFADFGGGKDRFNYPKYYNTITLVDKLGQSTTTDGGTNTETPDVSGGDDVASITFADSAEAYSALQSELEIATKISGDTAYEKYYEADSIESLKTAAQAAQGLTETNTLEELTAAVISLKEARIQMKTTMTLKELLDVVGELKEADFNSGDWTAIQDKVNEANGFLNEDGSEIADDAEALANIKYDIIKLLVENDSKLTATEENNNENSLDTTETPDVAEETGLQAWQIALIVVGVIVVVAVIVIIIVVVNKKKKAAGEVESEEEVSEEETEEEVEDEETAEEETEEVAEEETSEDNTDNE